MDTTKLRHPNDLFYSSPLLSHPSSPTTYQPVFNIRHLGGTRIRSCYGCGNPIHMELSYIPPPPHDLVVSHKERRYYRDPNTHEMRLTSNENNTHYHLMYYSEAPSIPGVDAACRFQKLSSYDVHRIHFFEQFGVHI